MFMGFQVYAPFLLLLAVVLPGCASLGPLKSENKNFVCKTTKETQKVVSLVVLPGEDGAVKSLFDLPQGDTLSGECKQINNVDYQCASMDGSLKVLWKGSGKARSGEVTIMRKRLFGTLGAKKILARCDDLP